MTEKTPIYKWMMFTYNFPHDFIEKVWGDDPSLVSHFKGKFNSYYNSYGPYGVIPAFYGDLSVNNQQKLEEWVLANF